MGWASGMRAGIDIGRAYNEGVERKRLEGIRTAAPETSQGYTAEQGQQLEAMASAINPETGRPYYNVQVGEGGNYTVTPDFTEAQTPRTGMDTGSQYGVANVELQPTGLGRAGVVAQPIPFNQQRVTDFLGRRFEGELTPDRIEALRSRAMAEGLSDPRMRQAALAEATRAEREAEEAPLRQEALRTQVAAGKLGLTKTEQDIATGALTLEQQKRIATEQQNATNFSNFAAERPDATVAELKEAAFKQFKFTPKQWQDTVTTRLGIENAEMDSFKNNIKKKLQGKSLTQIGSIYNSDPDFDDKTDLAIVPGKGGAVTLNFIDKATNTITSSQSFKNEALATEYLNKQATEPETIGSWMMNLRKAESAIEAQGAATEASRSTVGLNAAKTAQTNAQTKILNMNLEGNEKARELQVKLANLTDENDPTGTNRARLIDQFNMLGAGVGKTIPSGSTGKKGGSVLQTPVDLKKNDDGTYTAFSKDGGRALYNTFNGEEIPLGMTVDGYNKMKVDAQKNGVPLITGEDNGRLVLKFAGADGKFYDDAEKAKYAKPAKPAAQPGGLDTSRTTVVQPAAEPTVPTPKPEKRSGETQTDFRNRLLAWDRNRMAYERLMTEQRLRGQLSGNAAGLRRPLVE